MNRYRVTIQSFLFRGTVIVTAESAQQAAVFASEAEGYPVKCVSKVEQIIVHDKPITKGVATQFKKIVDGLRKKLQQGELKLK